MNKLVSIKELSAQTGIPKRTLRTLHTARKIPYFKGGHRTVFYDPEKVMAAIQRLEVKEVARPRDGGETGSLTKGFAAL